jgi:cellulose synthase/poly-beta-1,6-N-acetylglucosamine synthase-like glycosyltransferase
MKISLLLPAHNEGKTLSRCLDSVFSQTYELDEVVIVNDGSTDNTWEIIDLYHEKYPKVVKAIHLQKNTWNKSKAQEHGLKSVTGDIVIMTDADTILHEKFAEVVIQDFIDLADPNIVAVWGHVSSIKHNWLTACREIDYVIGQYIFKKAQSILHYIYVMPGCATAIRTDILRELIFHHDTVTEDLDFTFQLHLKDLLIHYDERAIVYTQDPPNITSYMRQMSRWYGGAWQNFRKYWRIIFRKPAAAFVISGLLFEGVVFSYGTLLMLIFYPDTYFGVIIPYNLVIGFFCAIFAVFHTKRFDLPLYFAHYVFIILINAFITAKTFFVEIVLSKKDLQWKKVDRVKI